MTVYATCAFCGDGHLDNFMRNGWDERAISNSMYFVASGRKDWRPEEFFESGHAEAHQFLDKFFHEMNFEADGKVMLEIGCGVGRMTRTLADMFCRVHATDLSWEMLTQAQHWLAWRPNILLTQGSGLALEQYAAESFDFVFCYIVFQHVPQVSIILEYIRELGRVLKGGGLFKIQLLVGRPSPLPVLKGRLRRFLYRKFRLLGIPLLDHHRDLTPENIEHFETWLGTSVPEEQLRVTLLQAQLEVTKWQGRHSVWIEGRKLSSMSARQ